MWKLFKYEIKLRKVPKVPKLLNQTGNKNPRKLLRGPAMRKMEGWTLVMFLLSTTLAMPLPQHPGYVNFSYEVMTPLKWYQSLIGHQYPRYGFEPMGGWMHHASGPTMPQTAFQSHPSMHSTFHQMQPPHPALNPHMQQPGHNSFGPMPGTNPLMPHFQPAHGGPINHPFPPHAEHPMHPQQPGNPIHPMHPQQPANPNPPIYSVQQMPPVISDTPLESWPPADKTKQEEVD